MEILCRVLSRTPGRGRAAWIGTPTLIALALACAKSPRLDPRVEGEWRGNAGGDPLLTLGKDGRYSSANLTQTKTILPEIGTYSVLPLEPGQTRGRLTGAEIVRLRYRLPDDVARILQRDPVVIRDLIYLPGVPALVEGDRDFVPESDTGTAWVRVVRWRASS